MILVIIKRTLICLLVSVMVGTTLGCWSKRIKRSSRYSVDIKTWSFSGPSFSAFMYNTDISTYPSERRGVIYFKQNTLYFLKHNRLNKEIVTDTLTVSLTSDQVDSLYSLAYQYLSDFEIDNHIETGNEVYGVIEDGTNISLRLNYDGKAMECSQYRLKGISSASVGADKLVEFINKKASEEFKLY